jgi:hypothetical protein
LGGWAYDCLILLNRWIVMPEMVILPQQVRKPAARPQLGHPHPEPVAAYY